MSKFMLANDNAINKINPFVQDDFSLPGVVGQKHEFKEYIPRDDKKKEMFNDNTFICNHGVTSGDKVVDTCRPNGESCPLSRPIIPGRNIDLGYGNIGENNTHENYVQIRKIKHNRDEMLFYSLIIITYILFLSVLKR